MLDRLMILLEGLADIATRSTDIMSYSRWLRRIVLVALPLSIPLILVFIIFAAIILYVSALVVSIAQEVLAGRFDDLWNAESLQQRINR